MRFVHTLVHEILGVEGSRAGEAVLVDDQTRRVWACLTKDPSVHTEDADQSLAIGTMLLRGLVGGGPEGSFVERLAAEMELVRSEREPRKKGRSYLVLRRSGEVPDWEGEVEREVDNFVLRLNGAPKMGISEQSKELLATLVLALSIETGRTIRVKPYTDAVVFYREDGKKVFAKTLRASGELTVSTGLPDKSAKGTAEVFGELVSLSGLARVLQLYAASVETSDDRLRSFLSGWAALEIFVNKVFRQYEDRFFQRLTAHDHPDAHTQYVNRIREVMKDKYRLRDRFALIASALAPERADDDVERFAAAKEQRDRIAHGQDIKESELSVPSVHELLRTYLHLHARNVEQSGEG